MISHARISEPQYRAAVVGGGFFGCMLALALRRAGQSVALIEMNEQLLARASFNNQARVHGGYHYPRSLLTASRSRASFGRFVDEFEDCIVDSFAQYYAVARNLSKVTARQFFEFFRGLGSPIERAPARVCRWFDSALIEEVFRVEEAAFDAGRLRERLGRELTESRVDVRLSTRCLSASPAAEGGLQLTLQSPAGIQTLTAGEAFNCTYAGTNQLLTDSGLAPLELKHELAEIALVQPPDELAEAGVTVMCGPFFSLMPFPARGLHSLSHVRYTPHSAWTEPAEGAASPETVLAQAPRQSRVDFMLKDAARFLPLAARCRYVESLWEIKTTLPRSEHDDSRPILFRRHAGLSNLHCVLGAKIDNVFDLLDELDLGGRSKRQAI